MDPSFCRENNQRRHQERQCKELTQHTIKRTNRQIADMSRMWQMVHTSLTIITFYMRLWMHMKRRQQEHWQEHRQ